jgi:membrane dipeptidase
MKRAAPIALSAALLALGACQNLPAGDAAAPVDATHRKLLTLDTHLDSPVHFGRQGWSFGERHDMRSDIAQLDLPRMEDGNLDGGFFAVFTPQGPLTPDGYAQALRWAQARSLQIDQTVTRFGDRLGPTRASKTATRWATAWRCYLTSSARVCGWWAWSIPPTTSLRTRPPISRAGTA